MVISNGGHGADADCVLLVEDHQVLAASLQVSLRAEGLRAEIAPLTCTEAVLAAASRLQPTVAIVDLELGEPIGDGLTLIPPLARAGVGVLVVSATTSRPRLAACVEAGAKGFVPKSSTLDDLVRAVRAVVDDEPLLAAEEIRRLRSELVHHREEFDGLGRLTPRERMVLLMLVEGRSAAEISQRSYVSEGTVRSHIRSILAKLGVKSQLAAVAVARRAGW